MKVFKFGGASVKDAEGVKNILSVLKTTRRKRFGGYCFCNGKNDQSVRIASC